MQRKNKNLIVLTLVIILSLAMSITTVNMPLSKTAVPSEFVIGENMGFDLTPGRLNFGKIVPGHSASRTITVENNFEEPVIVSIESSGAISKNIIVSENNFRLNPGESKEITFSAHTDGLTEFKTYEGKVTIISRSI